MTEEEFDIIKDTSMGRPHVVILGAGASRAAFPNGDKNGKFLPLMNNLITVCGLDKILKNHGIQYDNNNFEEIYSKIHLDGNDLCLMELESTIFKYFQSLVITDEPTIYDFLAISLRPKDVIATFNWDPLLWQAMKRNKRWISMPHVAYLHGNVAIGFCNHDKQLGERGSKCPKCLNDFDEVNLLYPITKKNYKENPFIVAAWREIKKNLENAYILTIFGFGASKNDDGAVSILEDAWGAVAKRNLEQIEVIDIKDEDELKISWDQFIHSDHCEFKKEFVDSLLWKFPRRSCEALWAQNEEIQYIDPIGIPDSRGWAEIKKWYNLLIANEHLEN